MLILLVMFGSEREYLGSLLASDALLENSSRASKNNRFLQKVSVLAKERLLAKLSLLSTNWLMKIISFCEPSCN